MDAGIAGLVERLREMEENHAHLARSERASIRDAANALARMEGERRDVQRYNFLKSRIEIPGAIHHFLGLNNWHPDTDLRNIDAAIDEAIEAAKSDEAQP